MNSSSIVRAARAAIAMAVVSMLTSGCYVLQAAGGQMAVMAKRRPIPRVVADPATDAKIRTQLQTVEAIRDFATRELLLPDNGSYRQYADIHRDYVVWNVVAAPEFSLSPRQWCFPVAGCVAYRGYFKEARASRFAEGLRAQGLDVATGGVAAYSTLGHFDDPVLNTMLGWSDVQLASIIFHELTHQLLYVASDSAFNEALATTVEQEGVKRWLSAQGRDRDLALYVTQQDRYAQVVALLIDARTRLSALYARKLAPEEMRRLKAQEFAALRARFDALKSKWNGRAPYEAWFAQALNNAHLASVATYYVCVPGFMRELHESEGDLARFYARVREVGKLTLAERQRRVCGGG